MNFLNFKKRTLSTQSGFTRLEAGFTLLIASLLASLILSVGLSIFNIIIKEIILTSSARDSQYAFYSADTGIECGLYWDIKHQAFSLIPIPTNVQCNKDNVLVSAIAISGGAEYGFSLEFGPEEAYCATVVVKKTKEGEKTKTTIESRGYNTCVEGSQRRIERGLRTSY